MASVDFIQKRIEGAKKNIATLEKKLERILKAEESNYEKNNPYMYSDYDKRVTTRDLEEARKNLEKYEAQLAVEQEKAASRDIQVIVDFLNNWKDRVYKFYEKDIVAARKMWDRIRELNKKVGYFDRESADYLELEELRSTYYENLNGRYEYEEMNNPWTKRVEKHKVKKEDGCWEHIDRYYTPQNIEEGLTKLKRDLDNEANAKYDFIIERTNKIVGQITDASDLKIGGKGELNGIIIGTRGKAKVNTIGAGGYAIQIFHFRTLITEVK